MFKRLAPALLILLTACQAPVLNRPAATLNSQTAQNTGQNSVPNTPDSQTAPRFYDTAKDAFRWVEFEAKNWDIGARLAKVEGTSVDESGRCFEWRFYFTAPGKSKALLINSRREKREVANIYFGIGLEFSWRVDSGEALKLAKEKGLKRFPVTAMDLDGSLSWNIRSFDGSFRIDAR